MTNPQPTLFFDLIQFDTIPKSYVLLDHIKRSIETLHHIEFDVNLASQMPSLSPIDFWITKDETNEKYVLRWQIFKKNECFQGASPWKRVLKYIIPVVIFSALFNIPKFFETAVVHHTIEDKR